MTQRATMTTGRGFPKRLFCNPFFIASTATVLRLTPLFLAYRFKPWLVVGPSTGGEVIQIARSIASGNGFGNPVAGMTTGPTAWLCPVYPYIVAGAFKLAGIYTAESRLLLLVLNCVLAGLTVFPIYAIARRTVGTTTAICAAWMWVVLPVAWHVPLRLIWDSTLNALALAVLCWATLFMRGSRRRLPWAGYGAIWAIAALTSASVLSLMPFFLGWLIWELRQESLPWFKPVATAVLVFALGLAPWTLRNYLVFRQFVLIRSNFGLVLWMGNHPGTSGFDVSLTPFGNSQPAAAYRRMGEIAFMAEQKRNAYAFIASHPGRTLASAVHNAWTFWIDVTDQKANPWYGGHGYLNLRFLSNAALLLLGLAGIFRLLRSHNPAAPLYLSVLVIFPLIYYLTRPAVRFRFAIEPVLTVLAAYGAVWIWNWIDQRNLQRGDVEGKTETSSLYAG